ncbi:MAG TPA: hypothetical protein P5204_09125 [Kiritimatiellia bacterium]|nr:hypothetical protein [Kiritimatiellia bacterium]
MTTKRILWAAAIALAVLTVAVFAQQPSPAYYQSVPAPAQPTYYAPQPVYYAPAQPVYYAPQPAPAYAAEEEEEEEGYYWFWGQKWPGLALGPKFGTTGLGLEMTFGVNPYLNLRSGFNYGSFTWSQEFGNVDYDADVTMTSVPLLLDVHPFGGQFRITGGLYVQPGTKADLDATPTEPTQIGSHTYNPDTIGTLTGKIEVGDVLTPYVGIGFGNTVGEDQLLTLTLDIGVIFQSYDVSLDSDGAGMTAKLDTFREDLKKEEALLQEDADNWKIFPVVAISLAWHF